MKNRMAIFTVVVVTLAVFIISVYIAFHSMCACGAVGFRAVIHGAPQNTNVTEDGKPLFFHFDTKGDLVVERLLAGSHKLRIKHDGFSDEEVVVDGRDGDTRIVSVQLKHNTQ